MRTIDYTKDELSCIKAFNFLTIKPIIYVANVDEDSVAVGDNDYSLQLKEYAKLDHSKVIVMCAKLEEELSGLEDDEKKELLEGIGIKNSGLDNLIFATYDLLGLATFFTAGSDECRAWTFKKGMLAPECAGIIHNDFEKGFIKAEVMSFEDLYAYNDEKKVKEAGKLRIEGKDYALQDGDICYFRFNV